MSLPLPPGLPLPPPARNPPPLPLPAATRAPYDDFGVAELGGVVRVDVYGEVFADNNRCVAFLTPDQAMRMARQLGAAARKEGAK